MDAQTGWAREGLVAGAADVAVVALLVGRCAGGREVVVVLVLVWPGWGDGGDDGGGLLGGLLLLLLLGWWCGCVDWGWCWVEGCCC